jgi:glycosyltransferase 2 family protein
MKKTIKNIISLGIILLVIYFLYNSLSKNWTELDFSINQIDPIYTALVFLFLTSFYLFSAFNWKFILKKLGDNIQYSNSLKIKTLSDLGRYIPGKAWYVLGRAYFGKKKGISKSKIIISLMIEHLFLLAIAIALFILFNFKEIINLNISQTILNLIVLIGLGLLIFLPKLLNYLVNIGIRIKNKENKSEINLNIGIKNNLSLIIQYVLFWLIIGISFILTIKSIYPSLDLNNIFFFTGIFAISWSIGLLSFITPGGIGVREGIMTTLLIPYLPLTIAVAAPLLFRIYSIITEIILSLIVLKIKD